MMTSLVEAAIKQRLVVCVIAVVLFFFGLRAAGKLSVDAFPDVTNVQVQIATEATGRSPEEVERFVTVPIEMSMTGLPGLEEMRSLNKAGLSLITLVFTDKTDVYFARQLVMERLIEVGGRMPEGVTPVLGPVSTGLGEVYQYTLDRADDGDRELTQEELTERRIAQDWVVRRCCARSRRGGNQLAGRLRAAVPGAGQSRPPAPLPAHGAQVYQAVARNNANSGGGVLPQYAEQYLIRGVGLAKSVDDIGSIVLKEVNGTPVYVRDVAEVTIGHEVRQGAVVKNGVTEAVGGIVMMMRGGNAKEVVSRIKARVAEINEQGMLPGLQIVPYYDRSELVDAALWTVTKVLLEGVVLVVVVLFLFLGDVRSSVIVVATLVLTPLLTFMAMNQVGISANLMSLGAGHRHRPDGGRLGGGGRERLRAARPRGKTGLTHAGAGRGGAGSGHAGDLGRRHHHPGVPAADDAAGHGRQDVRAAGLHHRDRAGDLAVPVADAVAGAVVLPAQGRRRARHA
jgi:cobalt-zinc-cadmium resistance protein CzcA